VSNPVATLQTSYFIKSVLPTVPYAVFATWSVKHSRADINLRFTEWHKKNGNFWKTQQKLKKSKKKII